MTKFDQKFRSCLRGIRKALVDLRTKDTVTFSDKLAGLCGISSYIVFRKLKKLGYNIEICLAECINGGIYSHAYCLIDDKYVVDLTASQFGLNKFYLERKEDVNPHTYKGQYMSIFNKGKDFLKKVKTWGNQDPSFLCRKIKWGNYLTKM